MFVVIIHLIPENNILKIEPVSAMRIATPQNKQRLMSLDVFRGITIAGMIIVNNPGSWSHIYAPLEHAEWNGWTPTDLIFPFFLFIVGVSMHISFSRILASNQSLTPVYKKVLRRSALIFGIGLFLHLIPLHITDGYNWFSDTLANVRIMGVLQRIAVVYLLTALLILHTKPRAQLLWGIGLLAVYWLGMKFIPFPVEMKNQTVIMSGVLEKETNLAAFIDNWLLHGHTWLQGQWFHHDPEGLPSTIPAIVTALSGVFTGRWITSDKPGYEKVSGMYFAGALCLAVGSIMDLGFPINKYLWSPSYVIFMAGMSLIFLATCYYLIDIKQQRGWTRPFVVFGMNPLALYIFSAVFTRLTIVIRPGGTTLKGLVYDNLFSSWLNPVNASLAFALCYLALWYVVLAWMYNKKIFLKI